MTINAATVTTSASGQTTLAANSTQAALMAAIKTALIAALTVTTNNQLVAPTTTYDAFTSGSTVTNVYQLKNKTTSVSEYLVIASSLQSGTSYSIAQQLSHTWSTTNHAPTGTPGSQVQVGQIDLSKSVIINYVRHPEVNLVYLEQPNVRLELGNFYPITPNGWDITTSLPLFIPIDANFGMLNGIDVSYTPYPSCPAYNFLSKWSEFINANPTTQIPDVVAGLGVFVPSSNQGLASTFSTDLIVVAAAGSPIRSTTFTLSGAVTGTYTIILSNPGYPSLAIATA